MPDPRIPDLIDHCCPACGSARIDFCRVVLIAQTMPHRFDPATGDWEEDGPDSLGDTIHAGRWHAIGTCAACGQLVRIPEYANEGPVTPRHCIAGLCIRETTCPNNLHCRHHCSCPEEHL